MSPQGMWVFHEMKINVLTLITVYGNGDCICMSCNLACMICLLNFDMQI